MNVLLQLVHVILLFIKSWQIQLSNKVCKKNTSREQVEDDDDYILEFFILIWFDNRYFVFIFISQTNHTKQNKCLPFLACSLR